MGGKKSLFLPYPGRPTYPGRPSGLRNLSSACSRSWCLPVNRSRSELGSAASATGSANSARAICHNGVSTNPLRHHRHQRSTVRRLAPVSSRSFRTRVGLGPWRKVATSTTIRPRYTRRPRNRSDAGVHPLAAAVLGATEAETAVVRRRQRDAAARLAPVGGHVQLAAAHRTPLPVYLGRDLPVRLQQQLMESCVSEQLVPQRSPPLSAFPQRRRPLRERLCKLSEGLFYLPALIVLRIRD